MWNTIKNYATQPSTYKGLLQLLASFGILTLSPEAQEQLVQYAMAIVGGILAVIGMIDVVRDDKKS